VDPSDPLVQQLCDFLLYLTQENKFSHGTVKSYRSAICTTIRQSGGSDLSANPILRELVNSLKINAPKSALRVPQWDVYLVLEALKGQPFEPPTTCDLAHWSYKTAFLLALATAKRRSELHAIEFNTMRWGKKEVHLFLLPEFIAKNQRPGETFPAIVIPAMAHTLRKGDPDRTLCPHRALKWYLEKSKSLRSSQRRLFISFSKSGKEIAAPTLSRWIVKAVTIAMIQNGQLLCIKNTPRAHEVRAIATSLAIIRSVSMENILRAAFWRNESTFSRFYLRDMSHDMDGKARLPMVAAQQLLPKYNIFDAPVQRRSRLHVIKTNNRAITLRCPHLSQQGLASHPLLSSALRRIYQSILHGGTTTLSPSLGE
jgi:integrase